MELFTLSCTIAATTSNAILICDGVEDCWVPISLIERLETDAAEIDPRRIGQFSRDDEYEITIPEWFAKQKGLL